MFTPPEDIIRSEASESFFVGISNSQTVATTTQSVSTTSETFVTETPVTTILFSSVEGVQSGVPTRTTSTLTPTTLRNIEQLFETSLQPPESHSNQAGFVPPPIQPFSIHTFVESKSWGGGVATLTGVDNLSEASSSSTNCSPRSFDSSMPSINTTISTSISAIASNPTSTAPPIKRAGGRRPLRDDRISAEEEQRRCMRRERNKQAAARCRKRRLDQTNQLQGETDILEEKRMNLQQEIHHLQQQKEELEFLLAAHKNSCKKDSEATECVELKQESSIVIKHEPIDVEDPAPPIMQARPPPPSRPQRPTSLAVVPLSKGVLDLGVTIETPSNALRGLGLNFESMMEGGTGLTPVSALPVTSTGLTPLTTPVVSVTSASSGNNCGSQQRSASDISSPDGGTPPKLVSL